MVNFFCVSILPAKNGEKWQREGQTMLKKTKKQEYRKEIEAQNPVVGKNCSDYLIYL